MMLPLVSDLPRSRSSRIPTRSIILPNSIRMILRHFLSVLLGSSGGKDWSQRIRTSLPGACVGLPSGVPRTWWSLAAGQNVQAFLTGSKLYETFCFRGTLQVMNILAALPSPVDKKSSSSDGNSSKAPSPVCR